MSVIFETQLIPYIVANYELGFSWHVLRPDLGFSQISLFIECPVLCIQVLDSLLNIDYFNLLVIDI